jgi:hypothetical protein
MKNNPTLLIKFPTRQRKDKFFATLDKYVELLDDISNTRFVITMDVDDTVMNTPDVIARLETYKNLTYNYGYSKTKIEACNADVPASGWDILLLASDDMIPQLKGYDTIIRKNMLEHYPDMDGVLWFSDGYQKEKLNTLCILGRAYYDRFGYIYYPAYETWYCDNEFMEVANIYGRQTYFDHVIIKHEHPDNAGYEYDELYRNHRGDKSRFQTRKAHHFFIKRLLIIQPGRFGDIIACLPIAKWYSKMFLVHWLCPEEYHSLFRNIDYCTPVTADKVDYFRRIDLSFGFGGKPQKWWEATKETWWSFIDAKYHIAEVPLAERWNLVWRRDIDKERSLLSVIFKKQHVLIHTKSHSGGEIFNIPENAVHFMPIEGYNIFDWYEVINQAKEIICIDSSLSNFIESVPEWNQKPKTLHITLREPDNKYLRSIYRNNWQLI